MELVKFHRSIFLIAAFNIGCSSQSNDEKMLVEATNAFEYHKNDLLLDKFNFEGPILKDRVANFKPNHKYAVYSWYTHEIDTFWIYVEVDKTLKHEVSVSFSNNIDKLTQNRKVW